VSYTSTWWVLKSRPHPPSYSYNERSLAFTRYIFGLSIKTAQNGHFKSLFCLL
jgi:hypothetical protein